MTISIRRFVTADRDAVVRNDVRSFAAKTPVEEAAREWTRALEWDRFWVAEDDGELVGHAGAFSFDITVAVAGGGVARVPCSGVTWASVQVTHRRQGILRRFMEALEGDARDRGELALVLGASEGGIYERFGFGAASQQRDVVIDPQMVRFRPSAPSGGSVHFVQDFEAESQLRREIHGRYAWGHVGELSRSPQFWERLLGTEPEWRTAQPRHTLVHRDASGDPDGYACFTLADNWTGGRPLHTCEVTELIAETPVAHAELWRTICSLDLVMEIRTDVLALDDPLPLLLDNARAVRTTAVWDWLWVRLLDPEAAWAIRGLQPPDELVMSDADASSLWLGGGSARDLVRAGRAAELRPGAAADFDSLARCVPGPFCSTGF